LASARLHRLLHEVLTEEQISSGHKRR
jgi:hypothetical protein